MNDRELLPEEFLRLLQCPICHTPLHQADAQCVAALNARIRRGEVEDRLGRTIDELLAGGLLNEDESFLFPIYEGRAPSLIPDDAIARRYFGDASG